MEHLGAEGAATVAQLSALLDASEATVRRDLNALAAEGKLKKVFGQVTAATPRGLPLDQAFAQAKKLIAAATATALKAAL